MRYCDYYSNKARGQRRLQQQSAPGTTPVAVSAPEPEPDDFRRHCKRAWARLIRKVWAADPLSCPKCGGPLRIISFIEDAAIIEKILRHLWLIGESDDGVLVVVFTKRYGGQIYRIISARRASRRERSRYEEFRVRNGGRAPPRPCRAETLEFSFPIMLDCQDYRYIL